MFIDQRETAAHFLCGQIVITVSILEEDDHSSASRSKSSRSRLSSSLKRIDKYFDGFGGQIASWTFGHWKDRLTEGMDNIRLEYGRERNTRIK